MTDTVPVPIELLKRIEDEVYYDSLSPLKELRGYIPSPPKVGDEVTAAQIASLPPRTVLRDSDDDVWIVDGAGDLHLITFGRSGLNDDPQVAEDTEPYSPMIVSLPSDV